MKRTVAENKNFFKHYCYILVFNDNFKYIKKKKLAISNITERKNIFYC